MTLDDVITAAQHLADAHAVCMADLNKQSAAVFGEAEESLREAILAYGRSQRDRCAKLCVQAQPFGGRQWTPEQMACWEALEHVHGAISALPDEVEMNSERDAA